MDKLVYSFGDSHADGDAGMKNLLGGKGANVAQMCKLGIPVPPGFTITTEVCNYYTKNDNQYPQNLDKEVKDAVAKMENEMNLKFGDAANPLLVSVRSGARVSMPGMMDTVLNLGLNDEIVQGLIAKSGNEKFAWDTYRRFIQMYAGVVMSVEAASWDEHDPFEVEIDKIKAENGVQDDVDLNAVALQKLVEKFKQVVKDKAGREFPQDPYEQLWGAINAVFGSWNNQRAITYRKLNKIPDDWGTAVNVMAMVYGNMGEDCATGVAFTRDPATGDKHFFGEFLINAQGEDVVAGVRTPGQVTQKDSQSWAKERGVSEEERQAKYLSLEEKMPKAYAHLVKVYKTLENHYQDMQDIEFTIQQNKLFMLQTRNGKRTAAAALKIAVDMVDEGLIDEKTALLRVEAGSLDQLLHPNFDTSVKNEAIAKGLAASPGAAVGMAVFSADEAEKRANDGQQVILVRVETSPEDINGMAAAQGILTSRGGKTSHAAVVARGMGKCCVAGCGELAIDYKKRLFSVGDVTVKEGEWLSLDGSTGEIFVGQLSLVEPELKSDFHKLMEWASKVSKMQVRTNADTPADAQKAREFGAVGIGLCRTEHMFFDPQRIKSMRKMILANNTAEREIALAELLPYQRDDFYGILKAMQGLPVTIRLLDPPLHEFLPMDDENQGELAKELGISLEQIKTKVNALHEVNPMLGHRGCRLGITYPEITKMQVRAIMEAACQLTKEGVDVHPEIMIPLIGKSEEFIDQKQVAMEVVEKVLQETGQSPKYEIGTMIEIPRAALTADLIAKDAEFFSFGTNDLTQMCFGYSRDDIGTFLPEYLDKKILKVDPFQSIDQEGVGQLVKYGVERGRSVNPDLSVGICGEHGGDPDSVKFCYKVGMNYVSCSPYRVPIARLAAAQASLED